MRAALGLIVLLAGCLASVDAPDVREEALDVLVQDHDHFDASAHVGSMNLELVGYHNGFDGGDAASIPAGGWYTELAVTDQHVYLARQSDDGSFGGFGIIDIANVSAPRLVGAFHALGGADIEVNHDETRAFFATQRNSVEQMVASNQQEPSGARGISIVDISDKSAPALVNFMPLPANGPHTLTYHLHENGQELLIVCTYDLVSDPGTGAIVSAVPATQRVLIFAISGDRLEPISQYQVTASAPAGKLYFPHDAIPHRQDGRTILTVAYWDQGVHLVDITNPSSPTLLSAHTEFAPSSRNNIHQAKAFDSLIDGRRITVTEPEIIAADETGYFHFLDTTDPSSPKKMGHWTLPGELFVQSLEFSPHNFDTFDGKVALAHNHAGFWLVDVGSEKLLREPATVAYYMPAMERPESPRPIPYVWGVFAQEIQGETLLFVSDEATGLHILRP